MLEIESDVVTIKICIIYSVKSKKKKDKSSRYYKKKKKKASN